MKTAGIILAAGRGSRMRELTDAKPKCMLELAGRPLLHWQLEAMARAGIGSNIPDNILVVRGYKGHCLQGGFQTVDNPLWDRTNMLSSLLCARDFAARFFAGGGDKLLVSYSDIVWRPGHAKKLLEAKAAIAISYDLLWEKLWRLRFEDPLLDAETFLQKDGWLLEIGSKTGDMAKIQGQYMGLLAFNAAGWQTLLNVTAGLGENTAKTDMTAFLRHLLGLGIPIGAVPLEGGWCEADSASDIQKYEKALASGSWSHDWRENR